MPPEAETVTVAEPPKQAIDVADAEAVKPELIVNCRMEVLQPETEV